MCACAPVEEPDWEDDSDEYDEPEYCGKCGEEVDFPGDICWQCSAQLEEEEYEAERLAEEAEEQAEEQAEEKRIEGELETLHGDISTWETLCENCGRVVKFRQEMGQHMAYSCPHCGNEQVDNDGMHGRPKESKAPSETLGAHEGTVGEEWDLTAQGDDLSDSGWSWCEQCGEKTPDEELTYGNCGCEQCSDCGEYFTEDKFEGRWSMFGSFMPSYPLRCGCYRSDS